jgi:hypothetical protein
VQLFVDNDILLKLASADLLKNLTNIFSVTDSSIFFLPSAKYYISGNKKLKQKYSKEVIKNVLTTIDKYSAIPDEYIDQDLFSKLSNMDNIDSGEQILYSIKPTKDEYLILTGDKLSIQQLYSHHELNEIAAGLKNKIVCLECLFIKIMELYNFEEITNIIRESNYCGDKTIEIVFQQNRLTFELALDGLLSYFNDLNSLTNNSLFRFDPREF